MTTPTSIYIGEKKMDVHIGTGMFVVQILKEISQVPGENNLIIQKQEKISVITREEKKFLVTFQGAPGRDGADGADGQDGLSAYEVAVSNGFVGTEAEWLASLEGPPGNDGTGGLTPDAEGNIIFTPGENPDTDQPGYIIFQHPVTGYKLKLDISAFIASDRTVEFPDNSGKFVYRINNIFTPDEAGNITLPLSNTINPVYGDSSITPYFGKNIYLCYAYSGTLNIYLNSANNNVGEFIFKKSDGTTNPVVINTGYGGDGQEYIDVSLTSVSLNSQGDILHIVSDNTGWHSI